MKVVAKVGLEPTKDEGLSLRSVPFPLIPQGRNGAPSEIRTRDILLGKEAQ